MVGMRAVETRGSDLDVFNYANTDPTTPFFQKSLNGTRFFLTGTRPHLPGIAAFRDKSGIILTLCNHMIMEWRVLGDGGSRWNRKLYRDGRTRRGGDHGVSGETATCLVWDIQRGYPQTTLPGIITCLHADKAIICLYPVATVFVP